jgi:hypothetical protein
MLFVKKEMAPDLVSAYPNTLAILMLAVDLNVSQTPIVPRIKLVATINVLILVRVYVVAMLTVVF